MEEDNHLYKPVNPQPSEQASFLSKLFFCWALPIFYKSYGKTIREDFYIPLDSHKSEHLGNAFENTWRNECDKRINPKLWRVIWKVFWIEFIALSLLFTFSEFVLKMTQPLLIGKLLSYQISNTTTSTKENYYIYGSLIVLSNFLSVVIGHFYQLRIQHLGMKIRIGFSSLIYRKTLKINKKSLAESNVGNVINLLSNDVNRFDLAAMYFIHLCIAPIETAIIIYSLYVTIGPTCIAGIILLLLFVPVQMYLAKLMSLYRRKTAAKTDRRINLMEEILSGIQVIKMFTWEFFFKNKVTQTRNKEISKILKASYIRAFNVSSMLFLNRFGIFLCIMSYALTTQEVNAKYVFVVSSFYAILRQTITVYFPFGIQNFSETKISIQRIENFLKTHETEVTKNTTKPISEDQEHLLASNSDQYVETSVGVGLTKVSVKWKHSSQIYTLQNINLQVNKNEFVVITGPVGSGKSTLLYTILKELPLSEGNLDIRGTISYASQEPWLFCGSIRQNILFGSRFDIQKYNEIIRICQLEKDLTSLENGDSTLVGERGILLSGGQKIRINLARALYRDADIYLLDDPLAAVDVTVAQKIFHDCILEYLKNKCRILVTHHSSNLINTAHNIYVLDKNILTNLRHKKMIITNHNNKRVSTTEISNTYKNLKREQSDTPQNKVSFKNYKKYAEGGGHYCIVVFLFILFIATQVAASGVDYFVAFWSNLNETEDKHKFFKLGCYIYSGMIISLIFLSVTRSLMFFRICVKAAKTLHHQMLVRIISASMIFFETTSSGKILNRFSKDLGFIDETLPSLLMDTFQVAFIVLGSVILVAVVNPWMLMPTSLMFGLFYIFKTRFLARSRNIKRLESEARSPIYSHTNATIQGLATIRTFNVQDILKNEFDYYQDLHSSAFYMFLTCNRAFGFWLDMNCVFYTIAVTLGVMTLDISVGNVGLCITQSINLIGVLQWGIRQWSELENQMVNVERAVEYTKVPLEEDFENSKKTLENWPNNGEIKYESVSLKYYDKDRLSLNDVNFIINSQEKIGIVGRTGAGKSSLIAVLFRLHNFEGNIFIDSINIKDISLQELRSKISIIPQDPTLFSICLRDNIDPYKEFNDEEIWKVLEQVELKDLVLTLQHTLRHKVLQGGSNFSVGQKQLICLARAILRNNKIVVLDEATANIDLKTDFSVQQAVKKNFKNCTIITVAHRLNNIMKSDKILTVDNSRVIEFDRPNILLQNPESLFSKLVMENNNILPEFKE